MLEQRVQMEVFQRTGPSVIARLSASDGMNKKWLSLQQRRRIGHTLVAQLVVGPSIHQLRYCPVETHERRSLRLPNPIPCQLFSFIGCLPTAWV